MGFGIEVKNLHKSFGSNNVLRGINLSIRPGESFVILGGSGAGKSVFLKHLGGLLDPDEGDIILGDKKLNGASQTERTKTLDRVGFLFQEIGLFDFMKVWENVAFHYLQVQKIKSQQAKKMAVDLLQEVGISPLSADIYPPQTSLGMQKRIGFARVLARSPEAMFLDEPTSGLDPILSQRIGNLAAQVIRNSNATAVTITHDVNLAKTIADRVGLLHKGIFVWLGTRDEFVVTQDPAVKQFMTGSVYGPLDISDV